MSDLIDRQRAIEAVKLGITYAKLIDTETGELLEPFKASNDELKRAVQRIKNLPSAQPTFDARDTQYNLPIDTDLISRAEAIDAAQKWFDGLIVGSFNGLKKKLEAVPSAQPEIIRCKDCKHWMPYEWMFSEVWQSQNIDDYPEDEISCNYCDVHMKSSDFCSQAVRRTE